MLQQKTQNVIGQIFEDPDELRGEWIIPNFLSLPEEAGKIYSSPQFFFLDSCWCLEIYPNGCNDGKSEEGWVGIYLCMLNCGSPVTVNFLVFTRNANKKKANGFREETFNNDERMGFPNFVKRSDLQRAAAAASPSGTLTISYTLRSVERTPTENCEPASPCIVLASEILQQNMENVIGEIFEYHGEVTGQWIIPNFLSLPEEVDKMFSSPAFFFLDSFWCLDIYPNGQTEDQSDGWVAVFLSRLDSGPPVTVEFAFIAEIADKTGGASFYNNKPFNNNKYNRGSPCLLKRSDLQRWERAASPSDTLTIEYLLKSVELQPESTLCHRLWSTSLRWMDTLRTQARNYVGLGTQKNDVGLGTQKNGVVLGTQKNGVVLKLKDGRISVQREILESSSPVFARMFRTDVRESHTSEVNMEETRESHTGDMNIEETRESHTGEVNIEDTTLSVFRVALSYAYSGDPKGLSCENVCEVYKVAHKYEFQGLRELCAKFIKKTLCVDTVCDVIALPELYKETELMESAKDFFAKNKSDIFKSEQWKIFKRDNPEIAFLVLERVSAGDVYIDANPSDLPERATDFFSKSKTNETEIADIQEGQPRDCLSYFGACLGSRSVAMTVILAAYFIYFLGSKVSQASGEDN